MQRVRRRVLHCADGACKRVYIRICRACVIIGFLFSRARERAEMRGFFTSPEVSAATSYDGRFYLVLLIWIAFGLRCIRNVSVNWWWEFFFFLRFLYCVRYAEHFFSRWSNNIQTYFCTWDLFNCSLFIRGTGVHLANKLYDSRN